MHIYSGAGTLALLNYPPTTPPFTPTPYSGLNIKAAIWKNIEVLVLIDRYESLIANVEYDIIEDYAGLPGQNGSNRCWKT